MGHWTDNYFGKLYHEIYSQHLLEPQRALDEASFAAQVLDLGRRTVLDLACGYGRHARLLASSNRVYALDRNRDYVEAVKEDVSERLAKNLMPLQADMRNIPMADAAVDAAIMLFNSFGYFDAGDELVTTAAGEKGASGQVWRLPNVFYERNLVDPTFGRLKDPEQKQAESETNGPAAEGQQWEEKENLQVLREVVRVLKPGGGFLIEVPNKRPLLEVVEEDPRRLMVTEGYEIHEEFEWDARRQRLLNKTKFVSPAGEEAATYSLRLYEPAELKDLMRSAGFSIKRMFGDYEGDRFRPAASDVLIIHAARPARQRR